MIRSAVALVRLAAPAAAPPTDAELLRAFVAACGEFPRPDDAFAELVRRYGPMVLATCQRVLADVHDAEDAFQAVFLVFARKAGSIRGTNLAGWLYGVAVRTSRGVRFMRDRRRKHLRRGRGTMAGGQGSETSPHAALVVTEQAAIIDEELAKLPTHARDAVVLCELRGLSRKQASAELGIPEGTLSSRLAAAKRALAARLAARGVGGACALGAVLAPAAVSAALLESTAIAVRGAAGSVASAAAQAVMKGMLFDQLRAAVLTAAVCLTAVCGGLAMTGSPDAPPDTRTPAHAPHPTADPVALVKQLGSDDFTEREGAQKELRRLGSKAEAAIRAGLKSEDPEIRARCAKLLPEIRKDALDNLVATFDPAADNPSDHPIWKRFKAIAGDTRASRELFARFVTHSRLAPVSEEDNWLARLDAAETGPEAAAQQYRAALVKVGKQPRSSMPATFPPSIWPCDTANEVAYLLFLGSYAGTSSARPAGQDRAFASFVEGERRLHSERGLRLGLEGKELAPVPKNIFDDPAAFTKSTMKTFGGETVATPGTDRVFARLLTAWLERREPASDVVPPCFWLAVKHGAKEVLPFARIVAADRFQHSREPPPALYAAALAVVARFGTPADRPLFERHFKNQMAVVEFGKESGKGESKKSVPETAQLCDVAAGLALLLYGEDPVNYGFPRAHERKLKPGERPDVARYELYHFCFLDSEEESRRAAHAKVRAFLDKQMDAPKEEPRPDPTAAKLVEQLGGDDFAQREAAEKELRKLGAKAEAALRAGLKSQDPEIRTRCEKLLDAIRIDRLGSKDAPLWQKFKAVAGDDADAWKLYQRTVGTRRRGEMLLTAIDDPKKAAASYAQECDEIAKVLTGPQPVERDVTPDDLAALLFLGTLLDNDRKQPDRESVAVHGRLLKDGLTGETKTAYARLYASWAEPRPEYYASSLQVGLEQDVPVLIGVARKAVKDRPPWADLRGPALRFLGRHGTAADIPLVMKFADDRTECGRLPFSKIEGGAIGPWRPAVKNTDVVTQVRDVAVIVALELYKKRPQDFGFEQDIVQDGGPPAGAFWLGHLGFCRDADRTASHKKAKEWLDKQKK